MLQEAGSEPADAVGGALRRWFDDTRSSVVDQLTVTRSCDGRHIRCVAAEPLGPSTRLFERLAADGAGDSDLERLEALRALFAPARVGHFIDVSPRGVQRGWSFPCPLPLARVRGAIHHGWPNDRLALFSERHEISDCADLSRAVGTDGATRVRLALRARADAVDIAIDAFATFCLASPPRALLSDLDAAAAGLAVEIALSADDAQVTLRVEFPDEPGVDRACRALAVTRPTPPPRALGAPTALILSPRRDGFELALEHAVKR
jgi:hypothetical protein